jgi:hypothetical protein
MAEEVPMKEVFLRSSGALIASLILSASTVYAASVYVNPIRVCDDAGANCAGTGFFEAETDKIWAQANIDVTFLAIQDFNETDFLSLDDGSEILNLFQAPGHAQSSDAAIINLWFVDEIWPAGVDTTYGIALNNANGIAISDDTFSFNGGIGRLDTIAHELGHNLGLSHLYGSENAGFLMTSSADRNIPGGFDDIVPGPGDALDKLTAGEISLALQSSYVVPIPAAFWMFGSALGLLGWMRRKLT